MQAIPRGSLVLVTGVNGYIASHVADQLLARGLKVRGTVRDAFKEDYMRGIFDAKYGNKVFEVRIVKDMAVDGAFDDAVRDCAGVVHVASDFTFNPDPNMVIPMVVSGLKNALMAAASTPSVKRFVYTSSSAAATPPIVDKKFHVDASTWNNVDVELAWAPPPYNDDRKVSVYAASKTEAERECWRFVREERPNFVLNTVLPNCNIGTILSKHQRTSTGAWYRGMWEGNPEDVKRLRETFPPQHYVNVTDTALLHVAALLEEDVRGERLFAFAGPFSFNETAETLEKLDVDGYGNGSKKWNRIKNESKDLKIVDTERSKELLRRYGKSGFTSLEQSLIDVVTSWPAQDVTL